MGLLSELEQTQQSKISDLLYDNDDYGYNIIHYISSLSMVFLIIDYFKVLELLHMQRISLCEISKDILTPYEICAGKWHLESLKTLIELTDTRDSDEMDIPMVDHNRSFYNMDILKNALNLALDSKFSKLNEMKDVKVLDLLLEQIRIQFTVDSSKF
jgi:hypothetical protein